LILQQFSCQMILKIFGLTIPGFQRRILFQKFKVFSLRCSWEFQDYFFNFQTFWRILWLKKNFSEKKENVLEDFLSKLDPDLLKRSKNRLWTESRKSGDFELSHCPLRKSISHKILLKNFQFLFWCK